MCPEGAQCATNWLEFPSPVNDDVSRRAHSPASQPALMEDRAAPGRASSISASAGAAKDDATAGCAVSAILKAVTLRLVSEQERQAIIALTKPAIAFVVVLRLHLLNDLLRLVLSDYRSTACVRWIPLE